MLLYLHSRDGVCMFYPFFLGDDKLLQELIGAAPGRETVDQLTPCLSPDILVIPLARSSWWQHSVTFTGGSFSWVYRVSFRCLCSVVGCGPNSAAKARRYFLFSSPNVNPYSTIQHFYVYVYITSLSLPVEYFGSVSRHFYCCSLIIYRSHT